jgi:hypothetical protein
MTPTPAVSPEAGGPTISMTNVDVVGLFAITTLAIVALILIPWLVDIRRGYSSRDKAVALLANLLRDARLDKNDLESLAKQFLDSPSGIEGLGRMILALSLIGVIGLALIYLVLTDGSTGLDIAKTILTALVGALTTIIGFYFGSRAAAGTTSEAGGGAAGSAGGGGGAVGAPPASGGSVGAGIAGGAGAGAGPNPRAAQ